MVNLVIMGRSKPYISFLRDRVAAHSEIVVAGSASRINDALILTARQKPDVALLDTDLAGTQYTFIRRLCFRSPLTKILVMSDSFDTNAVEDYRKSGATGCVIKKPFMNIAAIVCKVHDDSFRRNGMVDSHGIIHDSQTLEDFMSADSETIEEFLAKKSNDKG